MSAYLFIAHDLAVMAAFCDQIAVMDAGKIVEIGTPETLDFIPTGPNDTAFDRGGP